MLFVFIYCSGRLLLSSRRKLFRFRSTLRSPFIRDMEAGQKQGPLLAHPSHAIF